MRKHSERGMGVGRTGEWARGSFRIRRFALSPILPLALLLVGCELGLPSDEGETGSGIISGTVTDSTNALIPNATIAVRGATSRNIVAAAGVYAANDLPAGAYSVTVVPPENYAVAANTNGTVPVEIVASETKTVNFRLRRVANSQTVPPQARE